MGHWRTSTGGHSKRGTLPDGFRRDFEPISGTRLVDSEGEPRRRCTHKRYCQECGKEVSTYKDATLDKVWCYVHDHLTPWTRQYLLDTRHVDRGWTEGGGRRVSASSDVI